MSGLSEDPSAAPSDRKGGPNGLLIMAIMGIGMLVGILFLAWLGTPRVEPAVGQKIEKLDLTPLVFADAPLSEKDLTGKVTVLHFWGTWCPPCRQEFPEFAKVAEAYQDNDGVQFISVSSSRGPEYDLPGLAEATKTFLERNNASVPTYADPAGLSRMQVTMLLPNGQLPYPCTFVLDREGVVAGVWLGFTPDGMRQVAEKVKSLL
ncbi:MAG: TlpA family protein disulfide reductase [Aureliella sp.]